MSIASACADIRPSCWRCNDAGKLLNLSVARVPRFLPCTCEAAQYAIEHVSRHDRKQVARGGK